jgi:hypothetical protein
MATANNFSIDGTNLGGLRKLTFAVENPIDPLGNQRGLTGPMRVMGERFADVPTVRIVKAYLGANGACVPIKKVDLDVIDDQGIRTGHLTLHDAIVTSWSMTSPEQPQPLPAGIQPPMLPDVEGFTLLSTHAIYQSGGASKTYHRADPNRQ